VSRVFEAPDARTLTIAAGGGRLQVAVSEQADRMAVRTDRLPPLPDRKVYQLWAVRSGRATSVGLVEDVRSGAVMPLPASGTTVAITVEPAGGSKAPTTRPIVSVDPASV
jgi:anti-sigma-K factor RskA